MVRTPNEGGGVDGVGFVRDVAICVKVSNLIRWFCGTRWIIFPLELAICVEDVDEFLTDF